MIRAEAMTHDAKAAGCAEHLTKLSSVRASPKWSFKGKPASTKRTQSPGPGDYQTVLSLNTKLNKGNGNPNSGFGGTSPREFLKPASAPGPGAYSPSDPTQVSTKHGFGTSPRRSLKLRTSPNPGPGTYLHKEVMGSEGPKFTAAARRQDLRRTSNVPGPGSYEVQSSAVIEAVPMYGFGKSPRSIRKRSTSPGPGAYDTNAENRNVSPKPTMGRRRESPRVATSPGPGAYSVAHTTFGY